MSIFNTPPIAKIYEALGALADKRILLTSENSAQVKSSAGDKTYTLSWSGDFSRISSNDNASYWQGYMGYPIVALLLLKGRITYDPQVATALKGIPWKAINTRHKNNYQESIAEVLQQAAARGIDPSSITRECERILEALKTFKIEQPPKKQKPPTEAPQPKQGELF